MVNVRHEADPDPKGSIGIQLSQYLKEVLNHYYFVIFRLITKKVCLRICKFHLKVPLTHPHFSCIGPDMPLIVPRMQESVIQILGNIFKISDTLFECLVYR